VAASNLTWIYMDYQQPCRALELAAAGFREFPASTHFLFPYAEAARECDSLELADSLYRALEQHLRTRPQPSGYNLFFCREKLVRINLARKDTLTALLWTRRALAEKLSAEASRRLREKREFLERFSHAGVEPDITKETP
jgi:hypothetical protein